ncbi:hypothetical protein PsorP6_013973 [Peronosclerospora sorghi]|uniref:Uncharacterized protein n=1 Tax=Peronosclerospora sorghi TaxID=230839 RepID=A0ACC0VHA1_9STRA|nr:hypothetical protein PsorP6_013973 [Peronosclerospora sorghi]
MIIIPGFDVVGMEKMIKRNWRTQCFFPAWEIMGQHFRPWIDASSHIHKMLDRKSHRGGKPNLSICGEVTVTKVRDVV